MAKIRVSKGRTINTGNYESLRLDVSLEEEFDLSESDIDLNFVRVRNKVNEFLSNLENEHGVRR